MDVVIVTSIAPFSIDKQKAAIASWLDAGCRVVSLNAPDELRVLEKEFPNVRFVEAQRDARTRHGKPLIYISDALQVLAEIGGDACGIVNSDIVLKAGNPSEFIKFVAEAVVGSFVFGARIDVGSLSNLNGKEYERGFDYFFFDRKIINCYKHASFCFGAPWWDYWFPLIAFLQGVPVKRLVSPVAFHVIHGDRWKHEDFEAYGLEMLEYLQENALVRSSESIAVSELRLVLQNENLLQVANAICVYLRYHVEPVFFNDVHSGIDRITMSRGQYANISGKLQVLGAICVKHQSTEMDLVDELTRCRHLIASIEGSKCWQLTKPIRWILDLLQPSGKRNLR